MIEKSNAVILHVTKHNDTTLIVNAYTEKYGRVAYLFVIGNSKASRMKRMLLSPLSIVTIECDYRAKEGLQKIRNVEALVLQQLQFDAVKGSVALFLSEFLMRVIREPEPYPKFFKFLTDTISLYNVMEEGKANFHLCFLFNLSSFMGFFPDTGSYIKGAYFDMLNGEFVTSRPTHNHILMPGDAEKFMLLSRMNFSNLHLFKFSRDERREALERMVEYYRIHQGFAELKSTEILKLLFD